MTTAERLARTAKRIAKVTAASGKAVRRRGPGLGDGPSCPGDPMHGATYLARDRRVIYCVHQSHDLTSPARWSNEPEA